MPAGSDRPAEPEEPPIRFTNNRKIDRDAEPAGSAPPGGETSAEGLAEETLEAADQPSEPNEDHAVTDTQSDVQTVPLEDLQRLSAEYTNYRRRAERERLAAGEVATARVAAELLPVLDDLDRAKAHGDLTGGLKAVADKLDAVTSKLGLTAFGEVGDAFDPSRHEAVMHDESDAVSVPTCTTVMRQGYQIGERLIRPAMVGVSDPAGGAGPEVDDAVEDAVAGSERHAAEQPEQ